LEPNTLENRLEEVERMNDGDQGRLCAQYPENPRWQQLVSQARQTNKDRDASELRSGLAPPTGSPFMCLRTGLEAISAGLCTEDWTCVAEGFAMLQLVEFGLRAFLLYDHEQRYPRKSTGE
jgi:hypothetical protein